MSLALLFHYLMLNMFRMLIHPSSGACDLFVELFRGLYCSGLMCVGVTLWYGCGGVVSVCRLKHCFSLHTDAPNSLNFYNNAISISYRRSHILTLSHFRRIYQLREKFQNKPSIGWLKKYKTENKTLLYGTVTYITALLLHIVAIHI